MFHLDVRWAGAAIVLTMLVLRARSLFTWLWDNLKWLFPEKELSSTRQVDLSLKRSSTKGRRFTLDVVYRSEDKPESSTPKLLKKIPPAIGCEALGGPKSVNITNVPLIPVASGSNEAIDSDER